MSAAAREAIAAALREARELHRRGESDAAIEACARALEQDDTRAEAWQLKAMVELQAGRLQAARESVARAIALAGEQPQLMLLEAHVLQDSREHATAEERLRRLAASQPQWAPGHVALGEVLVDRGRPGEALEAFRAAGAIEPGNAATWNNIGIALQALQRPAEAAQAFGRAVELRPQYALAHLNLARLAVHADPATALVHAQAAVKADPRLAHAWLLIGDIERHMFRPAEALAAIDRAIALGPRGPAAHNARAAVLAELGEAEEARREFRAVAQRHPENLQAALGAHLLLPRVYESAAHLEASRVAFGEGLGHLEAATPGFRFPSRETVLAHAAWTNFYLAYQGRNDRELQAA